MLEFFLWFLSAFSTPSLCPLVFLVLLVLCTPFRPSLYIFLFILVVAMAYAGKATAQNAAAPSGSACSFGAAAISSKVAASSGTPRALASSSSASARTLSSSLFFVSGMALSGSLPLGLSELSGSSAEASRPVHLLLSPLCPPPAETRNVEAGSLSASAAGAPGPARAPSVIVSPLREGSAPLEVPCGGLPLFMLEEPSSGASFSDVRASRALSPPLASSAGGAPASSCLPSHASSGASSPSGYGLSARGRRGGARGCGRGRGSGSGGSGGSVGLPKPPLSPAMLTAERHAYMKVNAPGVVLTHHTDFCLREDVALAEMDLLGLAAVGDMTLCTNIAATVRVPAAMQGLLCVRCLRH